MRELDRVINSAYWSSLTNEQRQYLQYEIQKRQLQQEEEERKQRKEEERLEQEERQRWPQTITLSNRAREYIAQLKDNSELDKGRLEEYLTDNEFIEVFLITRSDFVAFLKWKQATLKRNVGLF